MINRVVNRTSAGGGILPYSSDGSESVLVFVNDAYLVWISVESDYSAL